MSNLQDFLANVAQVREKVSVRQELHDEAVRFPQRAAAEQGHDVSVVTQLLHHGNLLEKILHISRLSVL